MKRLFILLITIFFLSPFYGCRETVPPETLEDESTEKDSTNIDTGNYDDESS